jgi:hypothetical protein
MDGPTHVDRFGFEPYVKAVEAMIRSTESDDLPIAIGVYGPWGSGKTSFMYQLSDRLEGGSGSEPLPTVWFDAWKYDRTEDVRTALVYKILLNLHQRSSPSAGRKITTAMKTAGQLAVGLAAQSQLTFGMPGLGGAKVPSAKEVLASLPNRMKALQTAVDGFEKDFSEAVSAFLDELKQHPEATENDHERLIIFVDDLDRCLPDNVIVVLEALKLFLYKSPCVFVLAVDRAVVERAIEARYGTASGIHGREYLDKIVQHPFNLPSIDPACLETAFGQLLEVQNLHNQCREILLLAAESNPRAYLRLVNAWNLVLALAPNLGFDLHESDHLRTLAIATAVQIRFPRLYELIRKNEDGFGVFLGFCNIPGDAHSGASFDQSNAREFKEFWLDGTTARFFQNLRLRLRLSPEEILGPGHLIGQAFRLSASVS